MEIFELPLLSNKPDTLKLKFGLAKNLALPSTVRFLAISITEPVTVRLPSLVTFPAMLKADLSPP